MTTLTTAEAVPLGAALALRLAATEGVRALFLKGAALEQQGLRGPYESVDVDVWVDPAQHAHYLTVLADHGWEPMATLSALTLLPHHAVTVQHPNWPITLDVHREFPGFLAAPATAFEELWSRRTSVTAAGVEIPAPSPAAHAALAALHLLRTRGSGLASHGLPDLAVRVPQALGPEGLLELSKVASATGATDVLSDFLTQVGAPVVAATAHPDPAAAAMWEAYQHDVRGAAWLRTVLAQPWRRRPAALWQISALSGSEIDRVRRKGESRASARVRRLRAAATTLPGAARQLWLDGHRRSLR